MNKGLMKYVLKFQKCDKLSKKMKGSMNNRRLSLSKNATS